MSDLPFVALDMTESEVKLVLDIFEKIKIKYSVEFDNDFVCDLKTFALFEYESTEFLKLLKSNNQLS